MLSPMNPTGVNHSQEDIKLVARERVENIERAQRLERLLANEDFQYFLNHFRPAAMFCQQKARDIDNLPPEKREAYAQRFFELNELLTWPSTAMEASKARVAEIERTFGKQAERS